MHKRSLPSYLLASIPLLLLGLVACTSADDALLPSPATADWDSQPSRLGAWVPHSPIAQYSDGRAEALVDIAVDAGIDTLYLAVARNGCVYFETDFLPRCHDAADGVDAVARFIEIAHARGVRVIPWWERMIQVSHFDAPHYEGLLEPIVDHEHALSFVDLSHPTVRTNLLGALVDLALRYPVDAIQIDDHLSYNYTGFASADAAGYRQKLTSFVTYLLDGYRAQVPDTALQLAPNPNPVSNERYLADWGNWPLFDSYIVQCYRRSAAAITGDGNCQRTGGRVSNQRIVGLGVANMHLSDDELVSLVRDLNGSGLSMTMFELGDVAAGRDANLRARLRAAVGR